MNQLPTAIKNSLRGTRDIFGTVSSVRPLVSARRLKQLAEWLATSSLRAPAFHYGLRPRSIPHIRRERRVLEELDHPELELHWAANWILAHKKTVNEYLELRREYEELLMSTDVDTCLKALDAMEAKVGLSQWGVDSRLFALQNGKGLESQKTFLKQIRGQGKNTFVEFFSYYISERNEDTTNPFSFRRKIAKSVPEWMNSPALQNYALFKLTGFCDGKAGTVADILRWEFTSPILDLYETFISVATVCVVIRSEVLGGLTRLLLALQEKIADPRLSKLAFLLTSDLKYLAPCPILESGDLDKWCTGNQSALINKYESGSIHEIEALLAVAAAGVEAGGHLTHTPGSISSKIVQAATKIVSKKAGAEEARLELIRMGDNAPWASFGPSLSLFANSQMDSEADLNRETATIAMIRAKTVNPSHLAVVPDKVRQQFAALLGSSLQDSAALSLGRIRAGMEVNESKYEAIWEPLRKLAEAEAAYYRGEFERAASLSTEDLDRYSFALNRMFLRLAINSAIHAGDLKSSVRLISAGYLKDTAALPMLPLKQCFALCTEELLTDMRGELAVPIMLDLLSRHVEEHSTELRYAYEDFLAEHGVSRPSALVAIQSKFEHSALVYFLRFVCIPSVMQLSSPFTSSRDLEDERLSVCTLLKDIDARNAPSYDAEIREITRALGIRKGLREVESSKIWVDQEGLRRWAAKNLDESFTRFQALRAVLSGSTPTEKTEKLGSSAESQHSDSGGLPELPVDEAANLFIKMISQFVNRCFLDPRNGLDCFLSLRVRHGALSGQMRGPLEGEKIVTLQKSPGSGEYLSNKHWLNKLRQIDAEIALKVDEKLKVFSKDFDNLIEGFARTYVQIRDESKPSGLFQTSLEPAQILLVERDIHSETRLDSFLDLCFRLFWESVELSLGDIRSYIDLHLAPKLDALFLNLLRDVDEITSDLPTSDLDNAIRNAKTKATQALEQVKHWFQQPRPLASSVTTLDELIDISLQAVKKMHRDFSPEVEGDIQQLPSFVQLQRFTDIFIILFDNIWRHSGNQTAPKVRIKARLVDKNLRIEFRNSVEKGVRSNTTERRVATIQQKIAQGSYQPAVTTEGGTGLMKIHNIAGSERDGASALEFYFESDDWFFVGLTLPTTLTEVSVLGAE